jgi:hypothetical protein
MVVDSELHLAQYLLRYLIYQYIILDCLYEAMDGDLEVIDVPLDSDATTNSIPDDNGVQQQHPAEEQTQNRVMTIPTIDLANLGHSKDANLDNQHDNDVDVDDCNARDAINIGNTQCIDKCTPIEKDDDVSNVNDNEVLQANNLSAMSTICIQTVVVTDNCLNDAFDSSDVIEGSDNVPMIDEQTINSEFEDFHMTKDAQASIDVPSVNVGSDGATDLTATIQIDVTSNENIPTDVDDDDDDDFGDFDNAKPVDVPTGSQSVLVDDNNHDFGEFSTVEPTSANSNLPDSGDSDDFGDFESMENVVVPSTNGLVPVDNDDDDDDDFGDFDEAPQSLTAEGGEPVEPSVPCEPLPQPSIGGDPIIERLQSTLPEIFNRSLEAKLVEENDDNEPIPYFAESEIVTLETVLVRSG